MPLTVPRGEPNALLQLGAEIQHQLEQLNRTAAHPRCQLRWKRIQKENHKQDAPVPTELSAKSEQLPSCPCKTQLYVRLLFQRSNSSDTEGKEVHLSAPWVSGSR